MSEPLSELEKMVAYDLKSVLGYLTRKDKMSLRAASTTLLSRINELETTFKVWRIEKVNSTKLKRVADEISIIQGIF